MRIIINPNDYTELHLQINAVNEYIGRNCTEKDGIVTGSELIEIQVHNGVRCINVECFMENNDTVFTL